MISGIIGLLVADATVQTKVGTSTSGDYKIYPVRAPQSEKRPYIVLRRTANQPLDYKTQPTSDDKASFSVLVYAESYAQCEEISEAVRDCLDGNRTAPYKLIWFNTSEDLFDPGDGNNGSVVINNLYRAWISR